MSISINKEKSSLDNFMSSELFSSFRFAFGFSSDLFYYFICLFSICARNL